MTHLFLPKYGYDTATTLIKEAAVKLKFELGLCLLHQRLHESGITKEELSRILFYKPERLTDYMDNKRIMPLKTAISIADTIGCSASDLYELIPVSTRSEPYQMT
jgi:plasmid maintenance system antidote protein VapI